MCFAYYFVILHVEQFSAQQPEYVFLRASVIMNIPDGFLQYYGRYNLIGWKPLQIW